MDFKGNKPISLSFHCSRSQPSYAEAGKIYINRDVHQIFLNAILGLSHLDLEENPGRCEADLGHCGNVRKNLTECRCIDLNRINKPYVRYQFENQVILEILSHSKIKQSQENHTPISFNLAVFGSCGLLGEEILLFRLFYEMFQKKISGTIQLFLIDQCYKKAIQTSSTRYAIQSQKDLDQFLREICGCLPPTLKVKGTVFGEADDYIEMAKRDNSYKQDLLVGADIQGCEDIIAKINSNTSNGSKQRPLVLVRNYGGAICKIKSDGILIECYLPYPPSSSTQTISQRQIDSHSRWDFNRILTE